jgi:hypothetical protein
MSLHHSQQTNLDHLLPEGITDYCRFDRFDFQLELSSTSAEGRWPTVNVWIDGKLAHSSKVIKQHEYTYSEILDMSLDAKVLEIEYADKTNQDTTTDADGEILENQSLTIKQLIVNGIDLIQNQTLYRLGDYTMYLPPEKRAYYIEHGYSVEPTHSLTMFENGKWRITMPLPITTNIVKLKAVQELHEKWPDPELLNAIVDTVNNIRRLEKLIKEQK